MVGRPIQTHQTGQTRRPVDRRAFLASPCPPVIHLKLMGPRGPILQMVNPGQGNRIALQKPISFWGRPRPLLDIFPNILCLSRGFTQIFGRTNPKRAQKRGF